MRKVRERVRAASQRNGGNPTTAKPDGTPTTIKEQWQRQYSRFFNFPSLPSSCPTLRTLYARCKKDNPFGVWVSASSMASEEHYLSKLVFSWLQVSCMEASHVRGSKVVFASYRYGLGQESLKDVINVGPPSSKLGSDVSPPSEFISSNGIHDRAAEKLSNANPVGTTTKHPIQSLSNVGSLQYTCLEATALAHDSEAACATLPPSFSALLPDSCMEAKQVAEPPTVPMTHDSQMMSSSNYGSMQYIYHEATALAHDSEATFATLLSSISARLSGSCSQAQQESPTVPMPCNVNSQMRVHSQLCSLDSWMADGMSSSIMPTLLLGDL